VILEATNAFELRIFRGQGTRLNAAKAIHDLGADVERGVFRVQPVPVSAWDVARRLSADHSPRLGARSLDILQLAVAIVLRADTFLTFDKNQAALAQAEGLQAPISL
jgi:predicted nucleic acid-binding protein